MVTNACQAVAEKQTKLTRAGNADGYVPELLLTTRSRNGNVEIRIRDNGSGIPQEAIGRIFDPFFTTKPPGRGTGLGLSICYDVVREHSGSIQVDSEPGEFTEMTVTLPSHRQPQQPPQNE